MDFLPATTKMPAVDCDNFAEQKSMALQKTEIPLIFPYYVCCVVTSYSYEQDHCAWKVEFLPV
ncbi:MAG: hypothetical protein RR710_08685, partial [Oscillospiraceae bacterium]